MERDKEILERLNSITEQEWKEIVNNLTKWVHFKLLFKTSSGAHSEQYLGISAIDYYIGGAIEKLFNLQCLWQYEKFNLLEQLQRIIGSMISESVRKFKTKKGISIPTEDTELNSIIENCDTEENEEDNNYQLFLNALSVCTTDDEELQLYTTAMYACSSYDEMSKELDWDKSKLYAMQRKLARRIIKYLQTKKDK